MSDGDVDTSSCADTSFESSMVSKPSPMTSELSSTSLPSSSAMMLNFLNYDPSCNRNRTDFTPYSSFTYFISRSVGLGFLCLPYAFKQVGVVVGLALCFIAGMTFTYSFTLLCRFRYKICQIHRVPTVPYQNLIEYSLAHGPTVIRRFSAFFRFTFTATNLTLNFGKSCLYTKFVSLTIYELLADMGFPVSLLNVSIGFDVVCLSFLLLPYGKFLKPLNILSYIACTVLLCVIFYDMYKSNVDIGSQTMISGDWTDVFQFFGILLFTFIPIVQVFRIEDGLTEPEDFVRPFNLLSTSMAVMTNAYIAIGLCGFLDQQDVPIIGNSLFQIMPGLRYRTIVKSCVAMNVTFFHRELNIESTLLWASAIKVAKVKNVKKKCRSPRTAYLSPSMFAGLTASTKILFTFCSFFVTIGVASPATCVFQVFVALVGYLGNACNMLVYPFVVELCVTHALHGMSARPYVIAKDVCLIVLGWSVFAFGTYSMVARITVGDD